MTQSVTPVEVGGANQPAWLRALNGVAAASGASGVAIAAVSYGATPKQAIIAAAVYGLIVAPSAKASRDALEANPKAGGSVGNYFLRMLARIG